MKRLNLILQDEQYEQYLAKNEVCEINRTFCKHNMKHFLSVARIGTIINLEESLGYDKEMIYIAAILHDIGRFKEYEDQIPHDEASWQLAKPILEKYGVKAVEIEMLQSAILGHREEGMDGFGELIYRADKLSRDCRHCHVQEACYWESSKKNMICKY